jgi:hypothetical protein
MRAEQGNGDTMQDTILKSAKDTLSFAIPFAFMLILSIFQLDERLATAAKPVTRRRYAVNDATQPTLRDPDGRVVKPSRPRHRRG